MAISNKHTFKVWHPEWRPSMEYKVREFQFAHPISRTDARDVLQRIEGYAVATEGEKRGPKVTTQRRSKKK